jgi:hypothetical protein
MKAKSTHRAAGIAILTAAPMLAQAPLNPPPKVLLISRQFIKPGRKTEVFKIERDSVLQQKRLQSPHSYWVLSSVSGRDDLWWLNGWDSYADVEKEMATVAQIPGLLEQWAANPALKADMVTDPREMYARFREDLSYGERSEKPSYFLITTVTVRPGFRTEFVELRKLIRRAQDSARVADNAAVYEVESGASDGTFIIFSSAASLEDAGALAQLHAREFETVLSVQARTQFRALSTSAILSSETALFTVSSELSMQPDK